MLDLLVVGLLIFCTASSTLWVGHGQSTFDVLRYGAKGNGQTDDSGAFLKAWDAACGATGYTIPTLLVPARHSFMLQPNYTQFKGPCKSKNIHIQFVDLDIGNHLAPRKSEWKSDIKDSWIVFSGVDGLCLYGSGVIDGQGLGWWKRTVKPIGLIPTALRFVSCHDLHISGLKHINGPGGHINVYGCNGVTLSHLNITSPGDSPNTDGIDISHSSQVKIFKSFIGVGHGISIGSLRGNDIVEDVHVWNCSINGATNGARIKTWPDGNGYTRNISFEHITFRNTKYPIIIDQHYSIKVQNEGGIKVSDVTYYNLEGTSATARGISLDCGPRICSNVTMNQINITSADSATKATAFCTNVQGTFKNTTPHVTC